MTQRARGGWGVWAVGAALLLLGLAVALSALTGPVTFSGPVVEQLPVISPPPPTPDLRESPGAPPPFVPEPVDAPTDSRLWRWVLIISMIALAVLVVWLGRYARRLARDAEPVPVPPATQGATSPAPQDLVAAADEGLALLAADGEVGDAVIACWVRLERAAERTGLPRDPASTPSEFTAALLVAGIGREAEVGELLGLYHRARFGSGPLPVGAAERAIGALAAIRESAQARTAAR